MQEMTWVEIAEKIRQTDVVLIPMGSTEQHGRHLPLGVDTFIPMYAAEEVAKRTGVPIAPPVWFAPCENHMGFPGTISVHPATIIALTGDICRSLGRHGFKNFVLLNGHTSGLNPALLCAADEIQATMPDVRVWVVDIFLMVKDAILETCESEVLYHAEELETSEMLIVRKDLVDMGKTAKVLPREKSQFMSIGERQVRDQVLFRRTATDWRRLSVDGQIGDPTVATEAKGRAVMDALVDRVVAFIGDLKR
jgi:creatinine amidohydrolase